jgi:AraC-like DNA-binding protein
MQRPVYLPTARELPDDVQRVLSHIEENAFDPALNVQRIRLQCGLRDNNVSSRFRLFVGATIRDYLESLRMEAAASLLKQSGATILEVAFAVGYNNLQTFYGAFRRKYSCTPDVYRRSIHLGARAPASPEARTLPRCPRPWPPA